MFEVREAPTTELEKIREVVNHELRTRRIDTSDAYEKATDRAFGAMTDPISPSILAGQTANTSTRGVPRGLTLDNVEDAFRYHPWHPGQADRGNQVREALVSAAKVILRNVPEGPDRSTALRKLREVRMDANSAITHNGQF